MAQDVLIFGLGVVSGVFVSIVGLFAWVILRGYD